MCYTAAEITRTLSPRPVQFYPQAGSTNDLARAWLEAGAPAGAVVVADEQVQGRGRLGRTWLAPAGTALIMSVIVHPTHTALGQVTMLGAVAICDMATRVGVAAGIKWPNDVQIDGKKLSGVLPEAVWDGERLVGVVLGIGVNIRTDFRGTPLKQTACSLEQAVGKRLDRLVLLSTLLERIETWAAQPPGTLFAAWRDRLVTIGRAVSVEQNGQSLRGTAEGVEPDGALLIRTAGGDVRRVIAGDVALGDEA
jgi:BirA family biotin operon repressor/biotin-[acetyl-CoA-carboxylase] ligase